MDPQLHRRHVSSRRAHHRGHGRGSQTADQLSGHGAEPAGGHLTAAYDFALPPELIAQHPAPERDGSRLLVLAGDHLVHAHFRELGTFLNAGDLLVLNETRVIAARLIGRRAVTGGRVELLLLHPAGATRYDPAAPRWIALARPARRLHPGDRVDFDGLGTAEIVGLHAEGMREIELQTSLPFEDFLARAGRLALPPYIHNDSAEAQERYQTIFARVPGSVAAPTASLHFTGDVLRDVEARGIDLARIVLDVGLGTFRPIAAERLDGHTMHSERYAIPTEAGARIEAALREGRRVVAAGTTVVRALEGNIQAHGRIVPGEGVTDLFITPGFQFRAVDAMITNFHLPKSSLLVLVSAFAGRERIAHAYAEAIAQRYRFFSFGDAMLIERTQPVPSGDEG
ncbi:MAG: tRNA preQ1(34) S-adenosylmethionine ribosyltransferase-isomerase QueA [Candidatus Eremiobacteraeota bacterium]|nr:tRNA preQ1(34) S-adenosylmethionine ribosyltransferase-isomerase QueA [Candidatus Eremiobacteraeota bacterium]